MDSIWRLLLGLTLALLPPATTAAAEKARDEVQVRALLFYTPSCPQCGELFDLYLPLLYERHGKHLEIAGIDVSASPGHAVYQAAISTRSLPPEQNKAPIMVVQDHVMVGLGAIGAGLGDDFATLAATPGSATWPAIPGLSVLLESGLRDIKSRVFEARGALALNSPDSTPLNSSAMGDRIANGLAILVLVGMLAALVHALLRLRNADSPRGHHPAAILGTLAIGLGISGYLAYTSLADVTPVCGPVGSCDVVQQSEYAKLFGIPMGVLGLLGYGAILLSWLLARRLSPSGGRWRWVPLAITLFGVLFSLRLTYLEPFVIGHTCLWCLGSAVTITSVLWLLAGETRQPGIQANR